MSFTDRKDIYTVEIRVLNYFELTYVVSKMLNLCVLGLDQVAPEILKTIKNTSINIAFALEIVTQFLAIEEIESWMKYIKCL